MTQRARKPRDKSLLTKGEPQKICDIDIAPWWRMDSYLIPFDGVSSNKQ